MKHSLKESMAAKLRAEKELSRAFEEIEHDRKDRKRYVTKFSFLLIVVVIAIYHGTVGIGTLLLPYKDRIDVVADNLNRLIPSFEEARKNFAHGALAFIRNVQSFVDKADKVVAPISGSVEQYTGPMTSQILEKIDPNGSYRAIISQYWEVMSNHLHRGMIYTTKAIISAAHEDEASSFAALPFVRTQYNESEVPGYLKENSKAFVEWMNDDINFRLKPKNFTFTQTEEFKRSFENPNSTQGAMAEVGEESIGSNIEFIPLVNITSIFTVTSDSEVKKLAPPSLKSGKVPSRKEYKELYAMPSHLVLNR